MQEGHSVIKFHSTAKRLTVRYWVFSVLNEAAFWRVHIQILKRTIYYCKVSLISGVLSLNKKLRKHLYTSRK